MNIVFYSGGADSTLMLYDILMSQKSNNDPFQIPVETVSINSSVLPGSYHQRIRRKKFKKFMQEKHNITYFSKEIDLPMAVDYNRGSSGLIQQPIWMALGALMCQHKDNICYGYIRGDDYWTLSEQFQRTFKDMTGLMGKECRMFFPLAEMHKWEIIRKLKQYELEPYVWICQSTDDFNIRDYDFDAEFQPCGRCESCIKYEMYEQYLDRLSPCFEYGAICEKELVKELQMPVDRLEALLKPVDRLEADIVKEKEDI